MMALDMSFILPANGKATPASIARKRQLAAALLQSGMDTSPIGSPWQAAARIAQGLVGGLDENRANSQEQQGISGANQALAAALQGQDPSALATAFNDPFLSPQAAIMGREQWNTAHPQPDPMGQLQMEKAQLEIDRLRHPQSDPPKFGVVGEDQFGNKQYGYPPAYDPNQPQPIPQPNAGGTIPANVADLH